MYTLKKSLGQHFLRDENISRKIVAALRQHPFTQLLEVGPGGGALTKYLLELEGVDLLAVELDEEKLRYLQTEETWPVLLGKILQGSIPRPRKTPFGINSPSSAISPTIFLHRSCLRCWIGKRSYKR